MFLILRTFLFYFFILMEEFSTQDLNLEETGTSTQLRSIQWIAGADSDLETSFQWIVGAGDGFDSSSLQFYGDADFGGMLFFLSMGWLTISLIYLASKVLTTIVFGKIFEKAKIAWWWALIPLANTYVFLKMVKLRFLFWLSLVPFLYLPLTVYFAMNGVFWLSKVVTWLLGLVGIIAGIFYVFILPFRVAKMFGKGFWFGIGLLFLPVIFYPILAFGNAQYQENQEPQVPPQN